MANFEELNLNKPLQKALADMGFDSPTPIQAKAFPTIMSGKDVVAIAQTGTGKTFAYLMPILRQLEFSEIRQPRVLIVVPTRELVVQVTGEIEKLTKFMNVRIGGIYGGTNINTQKTLVYNGLDILVGTPGRINDLILSRTLQLHAVKKFVIDEMDELLALGFRPQLLTLMQTLPERRQNLLFSATLDEDVEKIIKDYFTKPEYIELISRGTPIEKIIQKGYTVPNFYTKINLLEHLLLKNEDMSKVLVFTKNKKLADLLFAAIEPAFPGTIGIIHSNKSQPQRFAALNSFQEGSYRVLVATDIISRGLDIPDVTHVINFDTPAEPESYIHRIGRTGRADKIGHALVFISPMEKEFRVQIEELMRKPIPMEKMPKEVEVVDKLIPDEKPEKRDKNIAKFNKKLEVKGGGAFHEKSEKNKQTPNIGKRRQESQRRQKLKFMQKKKK
ncbi:MAG: box helicase [Bacteroidetes bacterium]|jgi:ATP-dependent RNA helicase RhlE|nr:box helicase [Bacteroidota bacterium]